MNFFESQDQARRNTGKLILLFALAIISLVVITNLVVFVALGFASGGAEGSAAGNMPGFDIKVFLVIGGAVTGVIALGSLYKIASLSGGGARVAESMNGRLLVSGSGDLNEQRVLNVVEEMAIASGTPVPPVYLIDEDGINAFAAGYTPSDAVIGVTRGTIEILTRDQLQGVIAHEFSHILHGDMRINIRLIGVLYGILVLGIVGRVLLYSGSYRRRSKDSGGVVMLGIGLIVVGFAGSFFGGLIKAAVSRQREYLADASAVQFTRNPDGIAGALMQIDHHSSRSYMQNPNSAEISHALFEAESVSAVSGWAATHPPLAERIGAILPGWDGEYSLIKGSARAKQEETASAVKETSAEDKLTGVLGAAAAVLMNESALEHTGNPGPEDLRQADLLIHSIAENFLEAAREPCGARAIIYYLVISSVDSIAAQQSEFLQSSADTGVHYELEKLLSSGVEIEDRQRLTLTTIALSSLRQLSAPQYQTFKRNFAELIAIDKKINLFEWSLQKIVFHHLDAVYDKNKNPKLGKKNLQHCAESSAVLLSILAQSNQQQGISVQEAFDQGREKLDLAIELIDVAAISFEKLNAALDDLNKLKPLQKPRLLKACIATVTADKEVAAIEAELVRAIAATIDCPMPPLY